MLNKHPLPSNGVKRDQDDVSGVYWRKSSHSMANGDCVEVAHLDGGRVGVRDSKDRSGPVLRFTPDEWTAFVGGVRNGEFDSL
jgi:Domain of unknown function (DUF397)